MEADAVHILLCAPDAFVTEHLRAAIVSCSYETKTPVRISTAAPESLADLGDLDVHIFVGCPEADGRLAVRTGAAPDLHIPRIILDSSAVAPQLPDSCIFDRWHLASMDETALRIAIRRALLFGKCVRSCRNAEVAARRASEQFRFALDTAKMKLWSYELPGDQNAGLHPDLHIAQIAKICFPLAHASELANLSTVLAAAIRNRDSFSVEFRITRPEGSAGWALAKGHVATGSDGAPRMIAGIELDVTDRKLLEEQLRRAQRMETIGQLAGGVAHDFNNLITAIFGHVAMGLEHLPPDHPSARSLQAIEKVAQQGNRVTRGLLSFSKHSAGDMRVVDLCRIVEEATRLVRPIMPASIRISVHIPPRDEPVYILADDAQLQQVILNIAINARDAMPDGGDLELTVLKDVDAVRENSARYAALRISDTGMGIAPELQDRIFDPFFTTKDRTYGTGLGLSIVHGIISEHGGLIRVHSAPQHGTTFEILFPRRLPPTGATTRSAPVSAVPRGSGELILVAEDHEQIRELIGANLRSLGYHVVLVSNGEDFLEAYHANRRNARLVLIDADLPKCTGIECVRRIREANDPVPVIIATGAVDVPVDELKDEYTVVLRKPYRMQMLAEQVAVLVKRTTPTGVEPP